LATLDTAGSGFQYVAGGFELSSDGQGGTLITYGSGTGDAVGRTGNEPSHTITIPPSHRVGLPLV